MRATDAFALTWRVCGRVFGRSADLVDLGDHIRWIGTSVLMFACVKKAMAPDGLRLALQSEFYDITVQKTKTSELKRSIDMLQPSWAV